MAKEHKEKKLKINRHNTAIKRSKLSAPTKWAMENGYIKGKIYDWGCGRGDDVNFLKEAGFDVIGYDPYYFPLNAPKYMKFDRFKTVTNNYVLNVIESKRERTMLLKKIAGEISDNTTVVLSVRRPAAIDKSAKQKGWKTYKDGYITSTNTFQKGFTPEEITKLCERFFEVLEIKKLSDGVALILKKK